MGAARFPLENKRCVVADAFPHIHILHVGIIRGEPLNTEHLTGFVDDTDVIETKNIKLDIHQVIQLFHVDHGNWIIRGRNAAKSDSLVDGKIADEHTAGMCADGNDGAVDNIHILEHFRELFSR